MTKIGDPMTSNKKMKNNNNCCVDNANNDVIHLLLVTLSTNMAPIGGGVCGPKKS